MKSTTCLHFESPRRKGGVERAKLKLKTIFKRSRLSFLQKK